MSRCCMLRVVANRRLVESNGSVGGSALAVRLHKRGKLTFL